MLAAVANHFQSDRRAVTSGGYKPVGSNKFLVL